MTSSHDEEFAALIHSAYAEPLTIAGEVGDQELTEIASMPPRAGVDLGVAGSLVQARDRLRSERRAKAGRGWRDGRTAVAVAVVVGAATLLGGLFGAASPGLLTGLAGALLVVLAAGALWVLWVRHGPHGPTVGERNLSRTSPPSSKPAKAWQRP